MQNNEFYLTPDTMKNMDPEELNADLSNSAAWYRGLLEEGSYLFYQGLLSRGHRWQ